MEKNDKERVKKLYQAYKEKVRTAREKAGRPLLYSEKILFSHLASWPSQGIVRGKSYLKFYPDRVAMQDATAQMAILQFIVTSKDRVAVPTTVHCDHLIRAESGSKEDLKRAISENEEVYNFLKTAAARYGIGFWQPGSGIIHQVVLEQYAFPGGMIIGTDSHTPNAGGLGMIAIGVGGADAVDVMAGEPWALRAPRFVGVHLKGKLSGWTSPKDVILKVAELLTVKGGTGKIVEYFGEGTKSISCTGKATITNMGAELGATTSIFPYDDRMCEYLEATDRADIAEWAESIREELSADKEVYDEPEKYFDEVIEINLSELEPAWVGPHTPDLRTPLSKIAEAVKENEYPDDIKYALIGSCTNSSYEDLTKAADIARQAKNRGLKTKIPLLITPGSDQIYRTVERDGLLSLFESVGATILANACGPCIGQWKRRDIKTGERNTIITSYNRNFRKRNDGNPETLAFISSPEVVTAVAFSGKLSFNPMSDTLVDSEGKEFIFSEPKGQPLPEAGFVFSTDGYIAPLDDESRQRVTVEIKPNSERLAFLEPFEAWDGKDFKDLVILLKAKGKCTTDHISQAGPWLKYRGHLDKISDNLYLGAFNSFTNEAGTGINILTGEKESLPKIARRYREQGVKWVVIGDENFGEGSSREHAAMEPRYMGCRAIIVKSFARIHETNLKKQGILPLVFMNASDYDLIEQDDKIDIVGLRELAPGKPVTVIIKKSDGKEVKIETSHSLTEEQIEWFKAGSALNYLRQK